MKNIFEPSGMIDGECRLNGSPVALITGAAGIIGPTIVKRLQAMGWRVVATDRTQSCFDLYEKAFGVSVGADEIIPAELGSQNGRVALVREVERRLGGISALVNGAAVNSGLPFESISEAEAQRLLAVNFLAPIFLAQAALPSLKRNGGCIVNLSSVLVNERRRGALLYACSKASLEKASEIMALELMETGVRVNNVRIGRVPGYAFLRESIEELPPEMARRMVRDLLAERIKEMEATCGAQGIGKPEDIANTVAFLLSSQARFINGQTLVADGGFDPNGSSVVSTNSPSLEERIANWVERQKTKVENPCASLK